MSDIVVYKSKNIQKKNDNKKANKIKLLVISLVVIYIIAMTGMYISNPVNKITVIQGEIADEQSYEGYVIRDESVLSTNLVSDIMLTKTEGSRVGKSEIVATYISKNKQDMEEKIKKLDEKIQSAMENQNDIYSTDTKKIEAQIENVISKISNTNERQAILQYKKQIDSLTEKKAKMIGELSPAGSYINQLIKERNEYEKELNQSTDYIKTNMSGVVSTRIDGYENVLNAKDVEDITYEQLDNLKLRTDEIIPNSTKSIKIIDNYYCYIVVHIDDEHKDSIKEGDTVQIRLNYGNVEKTKAEIVNMKDEGDGKTVVLKISKNVEGLIDYRKISFDIIWWEQQGLKIPNAAVEGQGNNATVTLLKYGLEYTVRVKIKAQNEDYAIITDLSSSDIEELNLSSEDVKRSINIYDELVIK